MIFFIDASVLYSVSRDRKKCIINIKAHLVSLLLILQTGLKIGYDVWIEFCCII